MSRWYPPGRAPRPPLLRTAGLRVRVRGEDRRRPGSDAVEPPEGVVSLTPIRRLSGKQYRNTLRALFPAPMGETLASLSTFPVAGTKTGLKSGFTSDSDNTTVSTVDSNAIEDNAEVLADWLLTNAATAMPEVMTCAGYSDAEVDGCRRSPAAACAGPR